MMHENLIKRLRDKASALDYDGWVDTAASLEEAANAIEKLNKCAEEWKIIAHGWRTAYKGLENKIPHWIPVTDHTPKYSGYYLVRDTDDDVYTAYFGNTWRNWWTGSTITHWMPRPESPKETIPNEGEHEDGNLY